MAAQTYATHRHNPRLTGIGFLFLLLAAIAFTLRWLDVGGAVLFGVGLSSLMLSNLVLLLISRIYTTKLQDRIIRLEMKIRGAQMLSPAQQVTLAHLTMAQLVALRFASDGELPALVERADRDRLTADQIKRAITTWVPDLDRT
jgi:hypothetical protein